MLSTFKLFIFSTSNRVIKNSSILASNQNLFFYSIHFFFHSSIFTSLKSFMSIQFLPLMRPKDKKSILWINTYPFNTELSHVHHPFRPIIFFSNIGSLVIKVRLEVSKLFEIDKILTYE